jgi:hypothetical protein
VACAAVRTADLGAAAASFTLQVGLRASHSNNIRSHSAGVGRCRGGMHGIRPKGERKDAGGSASRNLKC